MEVGRFPSARAVSQAEDPVRAYEEERRLGYVAWTRARRSLTLVYDPTVPSPFLLEAFSADELGLEYDVAMSRLPSLGRRGEGWFVIQTALLRRRRRDVAARAGVVGHPPGRHVGRRASPASRLALCSSRAGRDALGAALTPLPYPEPDGGLVTDGVYARVRHPIYGGVILVAIGCGPADGLARRPRRGGRPVGLLRAQVAPRGGLARWPATRSTPAYRTRTRRFIPSLG